jgi:hypothetical protein
MYEAVSNSLHAIQERFGDDHVVAKGRIDIEVIREDNEDTGNPVLGFRVSDNGVGLDAKNYRSFRTPFSQHKIKKGGKGIGRLGWLKIFEDITVESQFNSAGKLEARDFRFILRESNQIEPIKGRALNGSDSGTVVSLNQFQEAYGSRCPVRASTIAQRIISHFLPIFAADQSPKIFLHDDDLIDLKSMFKEMEIKSVEELIEIEIDGVKQPILIRHMRCDKKIRPREGGNNWMCFCANDRGVKEFAIDEQIGLGLLNGEQIYVGTVTGDYLDSHVNPQRTDFIFEPEEGREIRRQVANSVKVFLKEFIDAALTQKKKITKGVIEKNPQYIYLNNDLDDFVQSLKPGSNNEEKIHQEMSLNRFRRQRNFRGVSAEIKGAAEYDEAISEKIEDYKKFLLDDKKGLLAEYIVKRKSVLDLLDTLSSFSKPDAEKYHLEEAVHRVICPMRVDSTQIDVARIIHDELGNGWRV